VNMSQAEEKRRRTEAQLEEILRYLRRSKQDVDSGKAEAMSVLKRIEACCELLLSLPPPLPPLTNSQGMMHEETNKVKQLMEVKSDIGKMHKESNLYDALINNIERATNPPGEVPSAYDKDKPWSLSFQDPPPGRLPLLHAYPSVVQRPQPYPPPHAQALQAPPGRYGGARALY